MKNYKPGGWAILPYHLGAPFPGAALGTGSSRFSERVGRGFDDKCRDVFAHPVREKMRTRVGHPHPSTSGEPQIPRLRPRLFCEQAGLRSGWQISGQWPVVSNSRSLACSGWWISGQWSVVSNSRSLACSGWWISGQWPVVSG